MQQAELESTCKRINLNATKDLDKSNGSEVCEPILPKPEPHQSNGKQLNCGESRAFTSKKIRCFFDNLLEHQYSESE